MVVLSMRKLRVALTTTLAIGTLLQLQLMKLTPRRPQVVKVEARSTRVLLHSLLQNMTTESFGHWHEEYGQQSIHADNPLDRVYMIPPQSDPLPTALVQYAWRNFSANNTDLMQDNALMPNVSDGNGNCPITSQFRFLQDTSGWRIETLSLDGQSKTVGGDELFVYYTDQNHTRTTAIAFVTDNEDGSYRLDFNKTASIPSDNEAESLTGKGTLTIVLSYSCGMGLIAPPRKRDWNTGGFIHIQYHLVGVTAPILHDFVPPNSLTKSINFAQYGKILVHGDSTMAHFQRFPENMQMWIGNNRYPLFDQNVRRVMNDIRDHMSWMNRTWDKVAFLFGSSAWDINADLDGLFGEHFESEIRNCQAVIEAFRQEFPNIEVYWRSGLAMHPHLSTRNTERKWHLDHRNKYMSIGRVKRLYDLQKSLMKSLSVPFLDMYPASYLAMDCHSTSSRVPGDAVHYNPSCNKMMTGWFYVNE